MAFPVFDIPAQRARIDPDGCAFEDVASGARVSYSELDRHTGQAAALLSTEGHRDGARVAILCRNRIEFFVMLFACARTGAILVPLNWRMPAAELEPLLRDCGARLLIHGREDTEVARQLASGALPLLDLDDSSAEGYAQRTRMIEPERPGTPRDAADTWYLLYTSGTTGRAKAVIQTFGMALANYVNISQAMGLSGNDRSLCFLPLFHTAGINLLALPLLIMGGTVLVTPGFDVEKTLDLIDEGRIDVMFAVPAVYQELSEHERFDRVDFSQIRSWGCGGAPMPDALFQAFAKRGAIVLNGMGMTETGPTVFLMDKANARHKIGSVGKPQILSDVRLVGPDGRDVPDGADGELWFAGPGITPGYYCQPEATREAFAEGCWLRSGDLGRRDADGYYYVVGRLKDMFISGGENVYPAEVENQLTDHPDILEAAVIGIPDSQWGEVGCAFLRTKPLESPPSTETLVTWLRGRLAPYKVP
ncbi:MAG: AMP-binding protein, partial [Xanthomonadales bacterium]|nr:AMP-binding protein [Xanthomonadales bacterium]